MTGQVGYDAHRVGVLKHHTLSAIGALDAIASDDPAAAGAIDAICEFRRVLDSQWMPTITAIEHHDPLMRGPDGFGADQNAAEQKLGEWRERSQWLGSPIAGPYAHLDHDALLEKLARLEWDAPIDEDHRPDPEDPFWDEFEPLARELARRVAIDPEFAAALVEGAPTNALIPIAVNFAYFPPRMIQSMMIEILQRTSHTVDYRSVYQAHGAETLMRELLSFPELLLGVLQDAPAARELVGWPLIDPDLAATAILTGLLAPDVDPALLRDGHLALQNIVTFANEAPFEEGFRAPIAEALAVAFAKYLPTYITSLEPGDDVDTAGLDRKHNDVTLGDREEFFDLLGALLRDPDAAAVLVATVHSATIASQTDDVEYEISDVGEFAVALTEAARQEGLEEEMQAAERRALFHRLTVVVGIATGYLGASVKLGGTAKTLISQFVKRGGAAARDRIDADETGIDDMGGATEAMIELGLCEAFLADPERYRTNTEPLDPQRLGDARRALRDVQAMIDGGQTLDVVDDALRDLQVDVAALGGDEFLEPLGDSPIRDLDTEVTEVDRGNK